MGLSIAIAGGIIMTTALIIFGVVSMTLDQLAEENEARTEAFTNNDSIAKTDIQIFGVNASVGSNLVNFTISNGGIEKVWNYDKFDFFVTYDADILGTKTRVTEQLKYNATAFDSSLAQATVTGDFKIQRGITDIPGTSQTITAGVEFEECNGDCFIIFTNSRYASMGRFTAGGNQNFNAFTVYVSNDDGLRPGGASTVTFERHTGTNDARVNWEIWEYVGHGPKNYLKVWDTGVCTFGTTENFCTGAPINNFDGRDKNVVVFITGLASPDTGRVSAESSRVTTDWDKMNDEPEFRRNAPMSDATDVSYAVVEFSGSNWSTQRTTHNFNIGGGVHTETISNVGEVSKAFIHPQMRNDQDADADGLNQMGTEVEITAPTTLTYRIPQQTDGYDQDIMDAVVWIIANHEVIPEEEMIVQHLNPPEHPSGGPEPEEWTEAVNIVREMSETGLTITDQSAGTGVNFPRGYTNVRLSADNQVTFAQSDTGQDQEITIEIIQFPRSEKCVGGDSSLIEIDEWTMSCITYDYLEPGIINPNEAPEILTKLQHPIFANGFLQITISTDNGEVDSQIRTVV